MVAVMMILRSTPNNIMNGGELIHRTFYWLTYKSAHKCHLPNAQSFNPFSISHIYSINEFFTSHFFTQVEIRFFDRARIRAPYFQNKTGIRIIASERNANKLVAHSTPSR
jgi:hypothetical protein